MYVCCFAAVSILDSWKNNRENPIPNEIKMKWIGSMGVRNVKPEKRRKRQPFGCLLICYQNSTVSGAAVKEEKVATAFRK